MASRPLERPWWQLTTRAWMGLAIGVGGIAVAVVLFLLLQEPVAWYQLAVAGFWSVVGPGFLISGVAQLVRERRLARSAPARPGASAGPRGEDGRPDDAPPGDLDDSFVPVPIRPAGLRRRDEPARVPESPVQERAAQERPVQERPAQKRPVQERTPEPAGPGDRVPSERPVGALVDPSPRTDTIVRPPGPAAPPATPGPAPGAATGGPAPGADTPVPTTTPLRLDHAPASGGAARTEALSARPEPPMTPAVATPDTSAPAVRRVTTPIASSSRDGEDRLRPAMSFGVPAPPASPAPTAPAPTDPAATAPAPTPPAPETSRRTTDPLTGPAPEPEPLTTPDHDPAESVPAPRGRHSAPGTSPSPPTRPVPATAGRGARHRSPSPQEEPRARHGAPRP